MIRLLLVAFCTVLGASGTYVLLSIEGNGQPYVIGGTVLAGLLSLAVGFVVTGRR